MEGSDPAGALHSLTGLSDAGQIPTIVLTSAFADLPQGAELAPSPTTVIVQKPVTRSVLTDALIQVLMKAPRPQAGVIPSAIPRSALAGMRALVVEDNELNQEVAAEILRLAGAALVLVRT